MTSVPADLMQLGNRIGSIVVNKDADIVIWDRSPFLLGAQADQVFLNGVQMVNNNLPAYTAQPFVTPAMTISPAGVCAANTPLTNITSYLVTNAQIFSGGGLLSSMGLTDGVQPNGRHGPDVRWHGRGGRYGDVPATATERLRAAATRPI